MTDSPAPIGGKYRLVRQIAAGGMGTVHEAVHVHTHGRVAIKILSEEAKREESARARFAREARASGRLRSRHVARVLDADTLDDGTPYLVMEYLDGEDLAHVVKARGPLPLAEVASILVQVCAGIAEAHQHGIVHRDLKPGNVFLANEGASRVVKVLDFGISKVSDESDGEELTRTFSTVGTPAYMSPEQIRSPKDVDAATDVWALGVMLHRLLAGSLPFSGNSSSVAVAICHDPPAPLTRPLPASVRELLDAMLAKDRTLRPTVRDVAEVLIEHVGESAPLARDAWSELSRLDLPRALPRSTAVVEPTFAATENNVVRDAPRKPRWPYAAVAAVIVAGSALAATRTRTQPAAPAVVSAPSPIVTAEPVASPGPSPSPQAVVAPSASSAPTPKAAPPPIAKPKPTTNAAPSIPARL